MDLLKFRGIDSKKKKVDVSVHMLPSSMNSKLSISMKLSNKINDLIYLKVEICYFEGANDFCKKFSRE